MYQALEHFRDVEAAGSNPVTSIILKTAWLLENIVIKRFLFVLNVANTIWNDIEKHKNCSQAAVKKRLNTLQAYPMSFPNFVKLMVNYSSYFDDLYVIISVSRLY